MLMKIWGNKTESLFDLWSLEHFISGLTIGTILCYIMLRYFSTQVQKDKVKQNPHFLFHYFTIILLIAYMWEVLEFYMEAGFTGNQKITYWFQGVEYWLNRFVTDPMMVALGAWLALKVDSKAITWSSRAFSPIWLGLHIMLFPHCMYLQNVLDDALPDTQMIQAAVSRVFIACTTLISSFLS